MIYQETLRVAAATFDEMEDACCEVQEQDKSNLFDQEVQFPTGLYMSVQVCPSRSDTAWTQGVLFDDGCEVGCTDVGEEFGGEYTVYHDGDEYTVIVERD